MCVMHGTLNSPRSTSTLVRMLPVAKKQPLPTTKVSGSVTSGTAENPKSQKCHEERDAESALQPADPWHSRGRRWRRRGG